MKKKLGFLGEQLIKGFEGLRLDAYLDDKGVPTIGWGHTSGVQLGQSITEAQAQAFFKSDVASAENDVNSLVKSNINQNQFDALVSFAFNVGYPQFSTSTLLKRVNENPNHPDIEYQWSRWKYDNGDVYDGLINRRKAEYGLYSLVSKKKSTNSNSVCCPCCGSSLLLTSE